MCSPKTVSHRAELYSFLGNTPINRFASLGICTLLLGLAPVACQHPSAPTRKIEPTYNKKTGRLELLRYDSNGDGTFDTFSYMDGARILRIEIDQDGDGKIDRWEYYGANQQIEKVGFSRSHDGVEDAWSFFNPAGGLDHIDISTKRNRQVDRVEHYDKGALVRAEEDGDSDGRFDKWETYEGERLTSVAFDTVRRGTPDRRLIYAADGSARVEVDSQGTGVFAAVTPPLPSATHTSR
jgi:hypothetical protein